MKKPEEYNEHELDALFREKLQTHQHAPAADSWARVAAEVKTSRKRGFGWFLLPVAALLLGVAFWFYVSETEPKDTPAVPETQEDVQRVPAERPEERQPQTELAVGREEEQSPKANSETKLEAQEQTTQDMPQLQRTATEKEAVAASDSQPDQNARQDSVRSLALPQPEQVADTTSTPEVIEVETKAEDTAAVSKPPSIRIEIRLGTSPATRQEEQDTQQKSQVGRVLENLWHLKQGDGKADINELISGKKSKKK